MKSHEGIPVDIYPSNEGHNKKDLVWKVFEFWSLIFVWYKKRNYTFDWANYSILLLVFQCFITTRWIQ